MADILAGIGTRRHSQTKQADPRQVKNAAGGYTFEVGDWERLHRFLTLGVEGGTYYASAKDFAEEHAGIVFRCASLDPVKLVSEIVKISTEGRAPRQNPAIFALAAASAVADDAGRKAALDAIPAVCRTATHLFLFAKYAKNFRGWGRGLRKAVGAWYTDKPLDKLAYQAVKYRNREGYTHRDLLRLSHPVADTASRAALFKWITHPDVPEGVFVDNEQVELPSLVEDFIETQSLQTVPEWVTIINRGNGISWEMLPDAALGSAAVWEALLEQGLPQTALMRQLPRLTNLGLVTGNSGRKIAEQLQDSDRLKKGRVHPINVLVAQRTYASGRGKGSTWQPNRQITDALDAAFYAAYGAVEPSGKRILLACDISGSMDTPVSGLPITCREAVGALALVTANVESDCGIVGFTSNSTRMSWGSWRDNTVLTELDISPRRRLDDVCRYMQLLPMGGTDIALPMTWAQENDQEFDAFVTYTDNETWAGSIHPHEALRRYREQINPNARMVVVAMTGTGNTVCDPNDLLSLEVSGFDSAVPNLITDFVRGEI